MRSIDVRDSMAAACAEQNEEVRERTWVTGAVRAQGGEVIVSACEDAGRRKGITAFLATPRRLSEAETSARPTRPLPSVNGWMDSNWACAIDA